MLPRPSFQTTPGARAMYEAHCAIPEAVAERLLVKPVATEQPVFLSRSGLGATKRHAVGEEAFEAELAAAGFAIVRPEEFGLAEQIRIVNEHAVIVGTIGSALHTVLFDISAQRRVVNLAYQSGPHPNYVMIDGVKGFESLQVGALREEKPDDTTDYSRRDRKLDVPLARQSLKDWGLL